jgi:putative NADH-flavin reductase
MENVKNITVIGGTGNLGAPVVKYLLDLDFEVNLIARDTEKAKRIFGNYQHIRISKADMKDIESLKIALSDTENLYLHLSTQTLDINTPFCNEREGIANILIAVNKKRIKQIIAISGLGALDNTTQSKSFQFIPNVIRKQGHKLIRESGIPYTLLHCSWFADSFVIYRRKNTYSVIGDTKNPLYFTNCYNYAVHLANAVANPKAFYREFPVQGREGFTHPEAAKNFNKIYSPDTKVSILSHGLIKVLALFIKEMKFVRHMSEYFSKSTEAFLAEEYGTYKILGEPKLSLAEYAIKLKTEKVYGYLEV